MSFSNKTDYDAARHHAQWTACYLLTRLADSSNAWDWSVLARAMHAAGQADAFYKCADFVEKATERTKKRASSSATVALGK